MVNNECICVVEIKTSFKVSGNAANLSVALLSFSLKKKRAKFKTIRALIFCRERLVLLSSFYRGFEWRSIHSDIRVLGVEARNDADGSFR